MDVYKQVVHNIFISDKVKVIPLFMLALFLMACRDHNNSNSITISGQKFENKEAQELNKLGIREAKDDNHNAAKDFFFQALELEPNNPTILSNIGLNYQSREMQQKAIEYHKKALSVSDSTYLIAGINLGYIYYQRKQFSKGIEILTYVIEESNDQEILTTAYINRGFNYMRRGECTKAKSDLNLAKRNDPNNGKHNFQIDRLENKIENCVQQRL